MVEPGGSARHAPSSVILDWRLGDFRRAAARRQASSRSEQGVVGQRQDCGRQQAGVGGAGLADRQRADRHAGRHLHDRQRLSRPFSALLSTGTPSTGSVVMAAVMPGRCAAPPAPAMITFSPRALALLAICVQPLRRAVRRDDLGLVGDAQLVQHLGGVLHRRPVGLAAHDDADERVGPAHEMSTGRKVTKTVPFRPVDIYA